jgi:ferritin
MNSIRCVSGCVLARHCSDTGRARVAQFFFRTADHEVLRYLKMFTFLPTKTIEGIFARHRVCFMDVSTSGGELYRLTRYYKKRPIPHSE